MKYELCILKVYSAISMLIFTIPNSHKRIIVMISNKVLRKIRSQKFLFNIIIFLRDLWSYITSTIKKTYSQYGEDKFVSAFFSEKKQGRYLDIGASHPFRISNTYLLYQLGWNGITVEPIPNLVNLHKKWRPRDEIIPEAIGIVNESMDFFEMVPSVLSTMDEKTANKYIKEKSAILFKRYKVKVRSVSDLIDYAFKKSHIDFMSIDIEGLDADIIESIDFSLYRPGLLCVEANDNKARQRIVSALTSQKYKILLNGPNIMACPE